MDKFPQNTAAEYVNELDTPRNVERYEVALTEISFPKDFDKRIATHRTFGFDLMGLNQPARRFKFKEGEYESIYAMFKTLESLNPDVKVKCFPESNGVTVSFHHEDITASMNPEEDARYRCAARENDYMGILEYTGAVSPVSLINFLLPTNTADLSTYFFTEKTIHLNFDVSQLPKIDFVYVHCDIIEPQESSGALERILRVVRVDGDKNIFSKYYIKPFFLPLAINRLERIKISLLDHKGDKIQFRSAPSSAVLQFRKRGIAL